MIAPPMLLKTPERPVATTAPQRTAPPKSQSDSRSRRSRYRRNQSAGSEARVATAAEPRNTASAPAGSESQSDAWPSKAMPSRSSSATQKKQPARGRRSGDPSSARAIRAGEGVDTCASRR